MSSFGDINRVNTNIQAQEAQLSLNRINRDMAKNQLKLSTGLRINKAEDDAAGYSIATKLNARVAGLDQALANVGDAKSVLDIAEGSLMTVMDQLIEMKALATQAASETLGSVERGFIAKQLEEIGNNINDIANQTVFQDYQLLNGKADDDGNPDWSGDPLELTFQVGERSTDTLKATLQTVNVGSLFDGLNITNIELAVNSDAGKLEFTNAEAVDFREFMDVIDTAIERMGERVNDIGVVQSSLSIRETTLSQAITANSSAASRIMDTDFAKEQSESIRLQILQQTATAALAQANNGPQSVLGFLQ
jgi:flagellin